ARRDRRERRRLAVEDAPPRGQGTAPAGPSRISGNTDDRWAARLADRTPAEGCARGRAAADEILERAAGLPFHHALPGARHLHLRSRGSTRQWSDAHGGQDRRDHGLLSLGTARAPTGAAARAAVGTVCSSHDARRK